MMKLLIMQVPPPHSTSLCRFLHPPYLIMQVPPPPVPHYAGSSTPGTSLCRFLHPQYLIMQVPPPQYLIMQVPPPLVPHYAGSSTPSTSLCRFLHPRYLIPLRLKHLLQHPSLKHPQPSSYLNVRDQVSHPHKTRSKMHFCIF